MLDSLNRYLLCRCDVAHDQPAVAGVCVYATCCGCHAAAQDLRSMGLGQHQHQQQDRGVPVPTQLPGPALPSNGYPVHTLLKAMLVMSFCGSCAPRSTWLGLLTYVQPCFSTI